MINKEERKILKAYREMKRCGARQIALVDTDKYRILEKKNKLPFLEESLKGTKYADIVEDYLYYVNLLNTISWHVHEFYDDYIEEVKDEIIRVLTGPGLVKNQGRLEIKNVYDCLYT